MFWSMENCFSIIFATVLQIAAGRNRTIGVESKIGVIALFLYIYSTQLIKKLKTFQIPCDEVSFQPS